MRCCRRQRERVSQRPACCRQPADAAPSMRGATVMFARKVERSSFCNRSRRQLQRTIRYTPSSSVRGSILMAAPKGWRCRTKRRKRRCCGEFTALQELNPCVVAEYTEQPPGRLTMGVNSFGFGGTNAHVILRDPEPLASTAAHPGAATENREIRPLLISAHDAEARKNLALRYTELLRSPAAPPLPALCRSAAARRTHHQHRLAAFGRTHEELAARLEAAAAGDSPPLLVQEQVRASPARLALVFSGNGSQWRGMGRDLLADPFIAASFGQGRSPLPPLRRRAWTNRL